jgi:hypothetical protein
MPNSLLKPDLKTGSRSQWFYADKNIVDNSLSILSASL